MHTGRHNTNNESISNFIEHHSTYFDKTPLLCQVIEAMQQYEQQAAKQYIAALSHDLRGPLNTVYTWAQVADQKIEQGDSLLQRALAGIKKGVEQQTQIINHIQNKTENNKEQFLPNFKTDLPTVLNHLVFTAQNLLDPGIKINMQLVENLPGINIEHQKLWQLLWNIFYLFFWSINSSLAVNISFAINDAYSQLTIYQENEINQEQTLSNTNKNRLRQLIEKINCLVKANHCLFEFDVEPLNRPVARLSLPI